MYKQLFSLNECLGKTIISTHKNEYRCYYILFNDETFIYISPENDYENIEFDFNLLKESILKCNAFEVLEAGIITKEEINKLNETRLYNEELERLNNVKNQKVNEINTLMILAEKYNFSLTENSLKDKK